MQRAMGSRQMGAKAQAQAVRRNVVAQVARRQQVLIAMISRTANAHPKQLTEGSLLRSVTQLS